MVLLHSEDSQSINQSLLCLQGRALRTGVTYLTEVRKLSRPSAFVEQAHHHHHHHHVIIMIIQFKNTSDRPK